MTTQHYVRDPQTGRLRRVEYRNSRGELVAPPAHTIVPVADASVPSSPPSTGTTGRQTIVYPASSQIVYQPTAPQQAPFVPPMHEAPTRYELSVRWDYNDRTMRRRRQGAPAGGVAQLFNVLVQAATWSLALFAVWTVGGWLWGRVAGLFAPSMPDWSDVAVIERGFGLSGAPDTAAVSEATADQPLVLGEAMLPADLGDLTVAGPPSITPEVINDWLAEHGSPATGTGDIWYAQGVQHGIDPVFAVAFFHHESSSGTNPNWAGIKPDGSTTHNVGNIICAGYATCYGRFRDYPSWEEGIADWYRLIDTEYLKGRNHRTVADIIPVYAPAFENDVQGYINAVQHTVRTLREWELQRQRRQQQGVSVSSSDDKGLSAAGKHLRIAGVKVRRDGQNVVVAGTATNVGVENYTINLSKFVLYDNTNGMWISESRDAEMKPGDTVPFDLTVSLPADRHLTRLTIHEEPGQLIEIALTDS